MNFFIFLDIDNTMWDRKDNLKYHTTSSVSYQNVSVESVDALNYFMFCLSKNEYTPKLVITSGDRRDWESCKSKLYSAGLDRDYDLLRLPINKKLDRWDRIGVMLHDDAKGKNSRVENCKRKYTIFDRPFFKFYKKVSNYAVIQNFMDQSLAPTLTISIGSEEKLTENKVNLFMARNGFTNNITYASFYGRDNYYKKIKNKMAVNNKSFYNFLKDEYREFRVAKKKEHFDEMTQNISMIHETAVFNKKQRLKKPKVMHGSLTTSQEQIAVENLKQCQKDAKQTKVKYELVPVEEESKFDFER